MFSEAVKKIYTAVSAIPFDTLIYFIWGSYIALFVVALLSALCSVRIKSLSKRPFLSLTNAFAALTLAAFLTECELAPSVIAAVLFWVCGYLLYGALCLCSGKKSEKRTVPAINSVNALPVQPQRITAETPADVPAAKNSVRLDHAVAVTDKLLTKNLSKSDRQELEKLKNTLAVLQIKGALTPVEGDILNENFNALLKLMAKYNV